jgi:hypothetical protein
MSATEKSKFGNDQMPSQTENCKMRMMVFMIQNIVFGPDSIYKFRVNLRFYSNMIP